MKIALQRQELGWRMFGAIYAGQVLSLSSDRASRDGRAGLLGVGWSGRRLNPIDLLARTLFDLSSEEGAEPRDERELGFTASLQTEILPSNTKMDYMLANQHTGTFFGL